MRFEHTPRDASGTRDVGLIPSAPFAGTGHPGRQFSDRHLGCNVPTPSRHEQIADHQLSFDRKSRLLFTPKLSLPNQSSVPLRKPKLTSASKHPPLRPKPQLLRLLLLAARLHPRLTRSPLRPPLRSPRLPLSRSSFTTRSRSFTRSPSSRRKRKWRKKRKKRRTDVPWLYCRRTCSKSCKLRSCCALAMARILSTSRVWVYFVVSLEVRRDVTSSGCSVSDIHR